MLSPESQRRRPGVGWRPVLVHDVAWGRGAGRPAGRAAGRAATRPTTRGGIPSGLPLHAGDGGAARRDVAWMHWLALALCSYPLVVAFGAMAAEGLERLRLVDLRDPGLALLPWQALPAWLALCLLLRLLHRWPDSAGWLRRAGRLGEHAAAVLITGLVALLGGLVTVGGVMGVVVASLALLWFGLRQLF